MLCPPMTVQSASIIFDNPPASISSSNWRSPSSRKADQRQSADGPAAHGIHIAQRIGGGDLAEDVRIVDDGGEEVDRLDERQLRRELIHAGVVGCVKADEHIGIMLPG